MTEGVEKCDRMYNIGCTKPAEKDQGVPNGRSGILHGIPNEFIEMRQGVEQLPNQKKNFQQPMTV